VKIANILFLSFFAFLVSCSKPAGTTSSKIKLVSGKAFSGLLATKANNGLVLYGKSSDGKSFLKRVDTDSIDLVFPNGTWNFYAIGWENASPTADTGFRGVVSCGKALGVQLNGTDATINMTISNANCDGAIHPDADTIGGEKKLAQFSINSCRDISSVTNPASATLCTSTNNNKGFATYLKVVMPEYKQFNAAGDGIFGPAIMSKCLEIDSSNAASAIASIDTTAINEMNLPLSGLNGMAIGVQVFYSEAACDSATGFDPFIWKEGQVSSKMKRFSDHPTIGTQAKDYYFIQTGPEDVCKTGRLSSTAFASGRGTSTLPYGICNVDQLKLVQSKFIDGTSPTNNKSFDLLSNLNLQHIPFTPIGDIISTNYNPINNYSGTFNGNGYRIDNVFIDCKGLYSGAAGSGVGLFRSSTGATFSNLTINKIAINCGNESTVNVVGGLVGASSNTKFNNIKIFGFVSGRDDVGGLTGYFAGGTNALIDDVHAEMMIEGRQYVGGVIGEGANLTSTANTVVFSKSSFKGAIKAKLKGAMQATVSTEAGAGTGALGDYRQVNAAFTLTAGPSLVVNDYIYWNPTASQWWKLDYNNGSLPYDSYAGGFAGKLASSAVAVVNQVKVDLEELQASRMFGGIVGESNNITFQHNYVTGYITNGDQKLDGLVGGTGFSRVGGIAGKITSTTINNNIAFVTKNITTSTPDTFNHGIVGEEVSTNTCSSNVYLGTSESGSCQAGAGKNISTIKSTSSYTTGYDYASSATIWTWPTSDQGEDIPRLTWELTKESTVPYLKRLCSNLYIEGNRTGTGDTASSPKSVCSWVQFLNMTPGKFYELKKSLVHDGSSLTTYQASGRLLAGVYHLNGNNFSLSNFFVSAGTLMSGLFESLDNGSDLLNLKIIQASLSTSGITYSASETYKAGVVAGANYGLIKNVEIRDSKVNIITPNFSGNTFAYVGGVVGVNGASGTLMGIENNTVVILDQPTTTASSNLNVGGVAAANLGSMYFVRQNGNITRKIGDYYGGAYYIASPGCSTPELGKYATNTTAAALALGLYRCNGSSWVDATALKMSLSERFGGFVAVNSGLIKEVEHEGDVFINDVPTNNQGKISPMIATLTSGSDLKDISFRGRMNASNHANITTFFDTFAGTINRMILKFDSYSANGTDFTAANSIIPSTGATEVICIGGTGMTDCHNNTMTYDYTAANGLTFKEAGTAVSGFTYLTNWIMQIGFIPDLTKVWNMEKDTNSSEEPKLVRTGGDFSRIGNGF
jgi:hypothetical protein